MKADQTLRAPITTSWLIIVNIKKNMQDDDLSEFVKPIVLLSTVQVGTIKIKITAEMPVRNN